MSTKNVQQKERHVQSVKSLTILQECANQTSKREKKQIHGVKEDESSDDGLYVGSVATTPAMSKNEWHADVKMEDKTLTVQLDTGARCNVISIKDLQRLGININLDKPETQLKSYSGHLIATKKVTM